jgi:SAM domain (Sterile alpha motif)
VDIASWLRGLGLGRYEQAFRDNDVDAEVLFELTAEDLIGLGVTSVGHLTCPASGGLGWAAVLRHWRTHEVMLGQAANRL